MAKLGANLVLQGAWYRERCKNVFLQPRKVPHFSYKSLSLHFGPFWVNLIYFWDHSVSLRTKFIHGINRVIFELFWTDCEANFIRGISKAIFEQSVAQNCFLLFSNLLQNDPICSGQIGPFWTFWAKGAKVEFSDLARRETTAHFHSALFLPHPA